jgi:hypothetical protein
MLQVSVWFIRITYIAARTALCMRFAVKLELSDQCSTDLATCLSQWAETAALGGRCGGGAVEAGDLGRALAGGL